MHIAIITQCNEQYNIGANDLAKLLVANYIIYMGTFNLCIMLGPPKLFPFAL